MSAGDGRESRGSQQYDESDIRTRPNPRGSRPRSKQRPKHDQARRGKVVLVDRGRYTVHLVQPGGEPGAVVTAMRARELGRRGLVVGDDVAVVGDTSGESGSLARIVSLEPRRTTLRRTADDADPIERVIVANADQLAVVVSAAEPEPRYGFIDRALVAGYDGGLLPLIIVTKDDLASPEPVQQTYAALDVPCVWLHAGGDLEPVLALLQDRTTVLIGQSGVGKSTLVNALVPQANRATGVVNDVTGRGRHTSTSVAALPLIGGGWIIDTPGVRSFGIAHVAVDRVIHAFGDLVAGTAECPRGCLHVDEHCALPEYAASGAAGPGGPARVASLRRLMSALVGTGTGQQDAEDRGEQE